MNKMVIIINDKDYNDDDGDYDDDGDEWLWQI